jgi:hypothetical protein
VAGRRSGASEEKEGERGLIHPQDRVLLPYDVLGGALRRPEIYVTQRAMKLTPLPPRGSLSQQGALERFDCEQPPRLRPLGHGRRPDDA